MLCPFSTSNVVSSSNSFINFVVSVHSPNLPDTDVKLNKTGVFKSLSWEEAVAARGITTDVFRFIEDDGISASIKDPDLSGLSSRNVNSSFWKVDGSP